MRDGAGHRSHHGPDWDESWSFDFWTAGGEVAGYARLGVRPGERTAWWWTAVVGRDLPFVLVREHDVDPPRPGSLEVRASGLWAEPVCEIPGEHWGLGLEAFGVAFDDPIEAYASERGDITPVGLDLEWEGGSDATCAVHGDVLLGRRRLTIEAQGRWQHEAAARDWWGPSAGWSRLAGQPVADLALDGRGLLAAYQPIHHAPLQVPPPEGDSRRPSRLARALCRLDSGELAWAERLSPQPASSATGGRG